MSAATDLWCAERGHPFVTYNPHLDRSYCRCGARQQAGDHDMDWQAKWEIFHDHGLNDPCRCYSPKESPTRHHVSWDGAA